LAPSARCREWSGVARSPEAANMKTQANSTRLGVSNGALRIHRNALPRHCRRVSANVLHTYGDGRMGGVGLKKAGRTIRLEPVADPEDGLDVLVGVPAELLAETPYVHVQRAG